MVGEIVSALGGEYQIESGDAPDSEDLHYPVLILSLNCGFCVPAKNFWSKIADESGVDLHVLIVENEEGVELNYGISGVPCLVCGPDKKYYGLHFSHNRAKEILSGITND